MPDNWLLLLWQRDFVARSDDVGFNAVIVNSSSKAIKYEPREGPRELKVAIASSARESVSLVLTAPTVKADGSLPGE